MSTDDPPMAEALSLQAASCFTHGSLVYGRLFDGLADDYRAHGTTFRFLDGRDRAVRDAVPLRFAGAIHRLALGGEAPTIARHYWSCGGAPGASLVNDFLNAVEANESVVRLALEQQVQTNEVGRSAVLAGGFTHLARTFGLPLRTFEIGASAGLISQWIRYGFDTGQTACGDLASSVLFGPAWWDRPADLAGELVIADRRASDLTPLDITNPNDQIKLLSFLWPDQVDRFARAEAAIAIAADKPLSIEAASADDWVEDNVLPVEGSITVLFHSIVWQYLPRTAQQRIRAHLERCGSLASATAPVAWLRLEPAGPVAALRLTTWPGEQEQLIATSSYHGSAISAV